MKIIRHVVLTLVLCAAIVNAHAVAPEQEGEYAGMLRSSYYDLETGKKRPIEPAPATMTISSANGNTVNFNFSGIDLTAQNCPFAPNRGSFYAGINGSPMITSTFKISGKGDNVIIRGKFTHINPYTIQEGTFVLKKLPPP